MVNNTYYNKNVYGNHNLIVTNANLDYKQGIGLIVILKLSIQYFGKLYIKLNSYIGSSFHYYHNNLIRTTNFIFEIIEPYFFHTNIPKSPSV